MRKIGQLKNADYAIEESDVAQMKHRSWNFPQITKDKIFKKSLFNFRIKYICEEMEGSIVIEDCENKAAEINIINYRSIKKHNEKGIYNYICIGAIQVYITHNKTLVKMLNA